MGGETGWATRARWMAAFLVAALGCDGPVDLVVDLKTDYVPGEEIALVRTELFDALPEDGDPPIASEERAIEAGQDLVAGLRIAELSSPSRGTAVLRTELVDRAGEVVTTRLSRVQLRADIQAVTVLITRSCAGVECAQGEACFGGECVAVECIEEDPGSCASACDADADCVPAASCAIGRCVAGGCLFQGRDATCAFDEFCDPESGCAPSALNMCPDGLSDCNRDRTDACEADLSAPATCGDCATACDPGLGCSAGTCEERLLWDGVVGDADYDCIYGVGVPSTDITVVSGNFRGAVDLLGAGMRTSTDDSGAQGAVFIAGVDPQSGAVLWDGVWQRANMFADHAIMPVRDGSFLWQAQNQAAMDFGGGNLPVVGAASAFLVAFEADGTWEWDYLLEDQPGPVAAAADGASFTATRLFGSDDFGGGTRTSPGGSLTTVVTALDPDGAYVWDQLHGSAGTDEVQGIVRASDGRLYYCGRYYESVDFGGGDRTTPDDMTAHAYVVGLTPDGDYRWDATWTETAVGSAEALALGADGNLRVAGYYSDGADFGGGARAATDINGFVLTLDTDGAYVADRTFESSGRLYIGDVTSSASGELWIVGFAEGDYDLGDAPRTAMATDVFVAALAPDGTTRWARAFPSAGFAFPTNIAIGGGRVYVTGRFAQDIDLGLGLRTSQGMQDGFVVALRDELAR